MGDFGTISWQGAPTSGPQRYQPDAQKMYRTFFEMAQERFPETTLSEPFQILDNQCVHLKDTYKKFISSIAKVPFIAGFIMWIREEAYQNASTLDAARTLLENDFIGTYDFQGQIWTMEMARGFEHKKILSAIRCKREWSYIRREATGHAYIDFMKWLSQVTYGYLAPPEDPDHVLTKNRRLPFSKFIEFLDALPHESSQLVAKLLYFAGDKTLDQVLKLDIQSVNFNALSFVWEKDLIDFQTYPEHIFYDIKALIGNRKQGLVFLGRQDAPLSDATIFRHFNEAAKKVGLGDSFGPKKLCASI